MDALGIHLTRAGARAVLVDAGGAMIGTATVESSDAFAAAADTVKRLRGERQTQHVGVAVDPLEGPDPSTVETRLSALGKVRSCRAGIAAVVAEVRAGAAKGASNAVCLWIGDSILAGLFLDGKPWTGSHGLAGSAAWFALNPVERQDYRKLGSFAAEVSSGGIARRLAWRVQAGDESAVVQRAGDLESITAAHVFDGARSRDGVSISVVREVARYIGMAVANFVTAVDPEVVVISGSIASAGDLLLDQVRQECSRRLPPALAEHLRCEMSSLGEHGVAVGAALLAGDEDNR